MDIKMSAMYYLHYLGAICFVFAVYSQVLVVQARPVNLTPENYYEVTKGKTLMVRFHVVETTSQVPCSSCKEIEKMWYTLAEKWANHSFALLADVKCSWDGNTYSNKLCIEHSIEKLLVFKFGDPLALEPIRWYDWDTVNYDTLAEFANSYLTKPVCTFLEESLAYCKRRELLQLRKALSSSEEELEKTIKLEELKMSRLDDVETEIENIKTASAEIQDSYKTAKTLISEEVRIIELVVEYSLAKKSRKAESTTDEDAVYICDTIIAEGQSECDHKVMQGLITTIQKMSEFEMRNLLNQQLGRLNYVHSQIDAQVDVLFSTSEKLRRDLVEEAEYLYHSARVEGYYFMKSAHKKKIMLRNVCNE